jgi:hypothetical protein
MSSADSTSFAPFFKRKDVAPPSVLLYRSGSAHTSCQYKSVLTGGAIMSIPQPKIRDFFEKPLTLWVSERYGTSMYITG